LNYEYPDKIYYSEKEIKNVAWDTLNKKIFGLDFGYS